MSKPSFHILPTGISVSYEGKVQTIPKDDRRHAKLLDAIRSGSFHLFGEILEDLERYFGKHEGAAFADGKVLIDGAQLPDDLNHYILGLAEESIPFDRMIAFWRRLVKSGRFGVKERLFKFLQRQEHPITEDGRFLAYRRVRIAQHPDHGGRILVDNYTGKINNSVGEIPYMDPSTVCDDPSITCAAGLHAASFEYAKNFYSDGVLIEIAIAPEDVICVPKEYRDEKMRTCRYEVLAEIAEPRSGPAVDLNDDMEDDVDLSPVGVMGGQEFDNDPEDDDDESY